MVRARILLADDEEDFVNLVAYNMRRLGYDLRCAPDGGEALRLAREIRPDLMILDFVLPVLDGISLCEILRSDRATRVIPIILFTAVPGQIVRLSGFEAGADAYLAKPVPMRELVGCVERLLIGRRSGRRSVRSAA
jgi:DNA-binding response OmpR family regulator